ncbi:MAG TPA: type II toxin-antitoxin system VapC family toxin [Thermomicrobiales bacterium]
MTRYMLDTSVLIDLSKSVGTTRAQVRGWIDGGDEVGVCGIQIAEFYRGLAPSERPVWDTFFAELQYWEISLEAARRAGTDQYDFDRRGQPIGTSDAIIAAVARAQSAILVTNNVRDFPMPDVQLLSLRGSPPST